MVQPYRFENEMVVVECGFPDIDLVGGGFASSATVGATLFDDLPEEDVMQRNQVIFSHTGSNSTEVWVLVVADFSGQFGQTHGVAVEPCFHDPGVHLASPIAKCGL